MMRTTSIIALLSIVSGGAYGQSVNDSIDALDACLQAARLANDICSNLLNAPEKRLDCFQKARKTQLECLEHVPSTGRMETTSPRAPSAMARPQSPSDIEAPEAPTGTVSPGKSTSSKRTPSGRIFGDQPGPPPKTIPGPLPPEMPTVSPRDMRTGAIRPDIPARGSDIPAGSQETNWIVSQTTSPIDYSPLLTATLRAITNTSDGPDTLSVRCREQRTELSLHADGAWLVSHGRELTAEFQIDEQPVIRLLLTPSADGKTATYRNDPVVFLQSLPEGSRLRINVSDRASPRHEATFQLAGWDAVRKKVEAACKWTPPADRLSSQRR